MKKDEEYPVHKMNDYFVHQVIIILLVLFKPTRMRDTLKKGKRHRIMSISWYIYHQIHIVLTHYSYSNFEFNLNSWRVLSTRHI